MTTFKHSLIFLILTSFLNVKGQTFDKTFSAQWYRTYWTYYFHKDGTFTRTSSGHFGDPTYTGTYLIKADTIHIIKGFENTYGTLNEYYLLDKDSVLIDLHNFYDYFPNLKYWSSSQRYDILKKPNMDSLVIVSKQQFDTMVGFYISYLNTHDIFEIQDTDHVKIIRIINTINMAQDSLFKTGIYTNFIKCVQSKDYEKITLLYQNWIPNKGMGFYFQKLQVELGGTPGLYSRYTLK